MLRPVFAKIVVTLWGLAVVVTSAQPSASTYGAESPQAVVAALQKAMAADDLPAALPLISPTGRQELAKDGLEGVLMFVKFMDPNDQMPGSKPLSKTELDAKRKGYKAALDLIRGALKPHALDSLIGQPPMSPKVREAMAASLPKADTVVLVTSLMTAMDRIGPMMGMSKGDSKRVPFSFGKVSDYKVQGDSATAKAEKETLEFERVQDRWYIKPPTPAK